jgi:hypothetical protein
MEVIGKVREVFNTVDVSPSFRKRELIVTTQEQYPQHISIEFTQDKTDLLNDLRPGDDVTVSINLRGREWRSPQGELKFFNSIQGWRIVKNIAQPITASNASAGYTGQSGAPMPPMPPMPEAPAAGGGDDDDLPF